MRTVLQKLDITKDRYEAIIWICYTNWCGHVTSNLKEFQQVLANASINTWFMMELINCEDKFHEMTDRYTKDNVTAQDYERCYHSCLLTLFNIKPIALLKNIQKKKSPPNGIKVFSAN